MQSALLEDKLRRALQGFYLGDAYGASNEAAGPAARVNTTTETQTATGETVTRDSTPLVWTENGDIVALLATTLSNRVYQQSAWADAISRWSHAGLPEIDKEPGEMSAVARKIVTDPGWRADPAGTAKRATRTAATMAHIVNINLPVATSIALLCNDTAAIVQYSSMYSCDPLTGAVAVFYVQALRVVIAQAPPPADVDSWIMAAAEDLPVILPFETVMAYAHARLGELELSTRPHYAMTTLKVICYAIRVVHYARTRGRRADIGRVLGHICAAGGDSSTNCAVAASIIHAGADTAGFGELWLDLDHRLWITDRIDDLIRCWFS